MLGNAGGIFGPSLFIGAMIGGAVGSVAHALLPGYTAEPGATRWWDGAAFAGIVRTPLTSVIMIFEVTRTNHHRPLMISNLIAYFISYKLQPEPITKHCASGWRTTANAASRAEAARIQWLRRCVRFRRYSRRRRRWPKPARAPTERPGRLAGGGHG